MTADVLRLSAFADGNPGGNPAGVVLDARPLDGETMQAIARRVGYAETAFVVEHAVGGDQRHVRLRYFSPGAEVPFCGHATIATAVALAERDGVGTYVFGTAAGDVRIETSTGADGSVTAAFTSVEPEVRELDGLTTDELLTLIGVGSDDLDTRFPVRESFAGNWHPVVAIRELERFDAFTFDPAAMRALMDARGWAGTVTVIHVPGSDAGGDTPPAHLEIEARNLFPVGAITEDPATGSAAASLGGYLRSLGAVTTPARVLVRQGRHVGLPSLLTVDIPVAGGVTVTGTATPIDEPGLPA